MSQVKLAAQVAMLAPTITLAATTAEGATCEPLPLACTYLHRLMLCLSLPEDGLILFWLACKPSCSLRMRKRTRKVP